MKLWHLTADAPRTPHRVRPGEPVHLDIGTWPIEPEQAVSVMLRVERAGGAREERRIDARWVTNREKNSYWRAEIGAFERGDRVRYAIEGRSSQGVAAGPTFTLKIGPRLHVALLWHQHQPVYKDTSQADPRGSYTQPWVRLHSLRDYVGMPSIVAAHKGVHLTINLTPSLLWQIEDYVLDGATDRVLELARKDPSKLTSFEQSEMVSRFFDAEATKQIGIHARYRELYEKRRAQQPFSTEDLADLRVWFQLAWFSEELRSGDVLLATGETASVKRLVEKGRGFSQDDFEEMIAEGEKMMRAVVPTHKKLQDAGQIEVSTTPFFHPILPLLVDTDRATIDRPGATFPPRFAYPEDAEAQVVRAIDFYKRTFGRRPRGMWPAEGAVAQFVVPFFAHGPLSWIATDRGVLARSGLHGYNAEDPDVLCRPYRAEEGDARIAIFFRDTRASDDIGFVYGAREPAAAAEAFVADLKTRFADRLRGEGDRVVTIAVDGENAWGGYEQDGRPFLHALYRLLEDDPDLQTVTFSEYLDGSSSRGVSAHAIGDLTRVYDLFTASWIDEAGSEKGVDLGTWVGETEENAAWALLGEARAFLRTKGLTPESSPKAFEALYIAEGSDWFWWFGDDQDSGHDDEFDDLFRMHVANIYRAAGVEPPDNVRNHIVPRAVTFSFGDPPPFVQIGDSLAVRAKTAGVLVWTANEKQLGAVAMMPIGGVMGGTIAYQTRIGPFTAAGEVRIVLRPEGGAAEVSAVVRVMPEARADA